MSGGKETPRQKMIGMMYLVLIALLALNVSATVLDKFVDINDSLEVSVDAAAEQNGNTLKRIQNAVEESGRRSGDVLILTRAEEIRKSTREMVAELEVYKEKFVEITKGRDPKTGELIGKTDYDMVGNYMMPDNQNNGVVLQKSLNTYAALVDSKVADSVASFPPLALDANDNPRYKDDPNQKGKDWATLEFMGTPTPAGLATISDYQNKVMAYEAKALDVLARKVGASDLKFDNINLVALPESKVVAAGAKYVASLIVAASSSAEDPEMTFNGKEITVEGGKGLIEFTASAGAYGADGTVRKTFVATAKLKDSTYTNEIEYFVAKPVIQVQSASLSTLYLNCGNKLNIGVPALGTSYNPSFSVKGGSSIAGKDRGLVTIVPNAPKVTISVSSNATRIGDVEFDVQRIPKPSIAVYAGSKPVNQKQGESLSALRVLRTAAIAEDNFKKQLPDDAQYRVTSWTIRLARGPRPIGQPLKATSETVNLSSLMSNARAGDRLIVEIDQVMRRNFRGNTEEVNLGEQIFSIQLN
ncbi:MAG: gliding motility-associated protein GldM [Marivirga sp.]|jgi:gliding motility-associated protein GldM